MNTRTNDDRLNVPGDSVTTMIDKGVCFRGSITSETGRTIMIAGEFHGELDTTGAVVINPDATVTGDITANKIVLRGQIVKGEKPSRVVVKDVLIMDANSRLEASELSYGGLELRLGATLRANVIPLEESAIARKGEPGVAASTSASGTSEAGDGDDAAGNVLPLTANANWR
jgi:cytoskeletal protein CcmA (bactofilin family)